MLLGNKVDLAQDDMRKVTTEVGQKLAQVTFVITFFL